MTHSTTLIDSIETTSDSIETSTQLNNSFTTPSLPIDIIQKSSISTSTQKPILQTVKDFFKTDLPDSFDQFPRIEEELFRLNSPLSELKSNIHALIPLMSSIAKMEKTLSKTVKGNYFFKNGFLSTHVYFVTTAK